MAKRLLGTYTTFHQALKDLRKEKGWSLRDAAKETGVSYTYLSKLENDNSGREHPSPEYIRRLAQSFQVPEIELLLLSRQLPEDYYANTELLEFLCRVPELSLDEWSLINQKDRTGSGSQAAAPPPVSSQASPAPKPPVAPLRTMCRTIPGGEVGVVMRKNLPSETWDILLKLYAPGDAPSPLVGEVTLLNVQTKHVRTGPFNALGNLAFPHVEEGAYMMMVALNGQYDTCPLEVKEA